MDLASNSSISLLEQTLANRLGRKHCIITGRAASAIYIALKALPGKPGKVVVPTITCPSPASVPLYAGWEPIFCDVSLRDFNLCPDALRQIMCSHPDVAAIMPVHLYGQAAPLHEILQIAKEYGVPVIEDAAQSLGGSYGGRMLGAWGEVSVISFGHTKTLDVGWGGAALTDDDALAERMRFEYAQLPARPAHINRLFEEWRKVYYSLIPLTEMNSALHELFVPLPHIFREMYLFKLEESQAPQILAALDDLDSLVAARRRHARTYRAALQHPALHHPVLDEHDAPWRYSFLAGHGLQSKITQALRAAKIDVSNWYPPLHRWYTSGRNQDQSLFQKAQQVAREVVNLWVSPNLTNERIAETCAIIHGVLAENF